MPSPALLAGTGFLSTTTEQWQWSADGSTGWTNLAGATGPTYVTQVGDSGRYISLLETATDDGGSTTQRSNVLGPIASAPVNTVAPAVTGTNAVGSVLTTTNGTWVGAATITFTYQWYRDANLIGGATASTYTPVDADDGTTVTCVVTGTNGVGSSTATSNGTLILEPTPVNSVPPVIAGQANVSSSLGITSNGTFSNMTGNIAGFSYQWQDSADGSTGWADIVGEINASTLVAIGDLTKYLRCNVVATNSGGDSAVIASNVIGPIGAALSGGDGGMSLILLLLT